MSRTTLHFLTDIFEAIEAIERFVEQMEQRQFEDDEKTLRAVEREFEIIGEAVKQIPEDITVNYPTVPWRAIAGMRDRLIHHYWVTEAEILWRTIDESLPPFKNSIVQIMKDHQEDN